MTKAALPALEGITALDGALRRAVAAESRATLRAARVNADVLLLHARRETLELVEHARRDADAIADASAARARVALHREVAAITLDARRAVMDDIATQVHDAVLALRDAPDYQYLLDGLAARARAQLGDDAVITRDPPDVGGVVAECCGRRLDYTLPALARLACADLGARIEELLQ